MVIRSFFLSRWILGFAIACSMAPATSAAQITESREKNGKFFTCTMSGLIPYESPCGLDGSWEDIFLGSVKTFQTLPDGEVRIWLRPEEVFRGTPGDEVIAETSQGECMPELRVGDRWLFYLWRNSTSNVLLMGYGTPGGPEATVADDLKLLRRLSKMANSGVVLGEVTREEHEPGRTSNTAVAGHRIELKSLTDNSKISVVSDKDGEYKFSDVPAGKYEMIANTSPGWFFPDGTIEVKPHSCSRTSVKLQPDGRISGHVRKADGSFATTGEVIALSDENSANILTSAWIKEDGSFELTGLFPGKYLVGLNFTWEGEEPPEGKPLFYPGVQRRSMAVPIALGRAEHRTGIDLNIPASAGN
jgi:hypothetical protein